MTKIGEHFRALLRMIGQEAAPFMRHQDAGHLPPSGPVGHIAGKACAAYGIAQGPHIQRRISVLLPNSEATRSTATSAVRLRRSSAGFNSMTSSDAKRPVSAI